MIFIALSVISPRLPIGVATMYNPFLLSAMICICTFLISCTPVNLYNNDKNYSIDKKIKQKEESTIYNLEIINEDKPEDKEIKNEKKIFQNMPLKREIIVIFPTHNKKEISNQFVNILELSLNDKKLENVNFKINFYDDTKHLKNILLQNAEPGRIFIGPLGSNDTKVIEDFCEKGVIFFSFSSQSNLASDCIFLLNFFPKNEIETLFSFLNSNDRVAFLYPENEYGYLINSIIDDIANKSEAIIVSRSSYKQDLSNVRNSIKELGKYELRKFELERQKKILSTKTDGDSKKRLKKLNKFTTTSDYDFTHLLIADYGLSMLQVAPLLTYYDIDPKIVQFMGTGVIDDEIFFSEPSLQGAIFPGVELNKRAKLIKEYNSIYNEKLLRISTLPYDLVGLINFMISENMYIYEVTKFLDNPEIKFDGIDGSFYFNNNKVQRELDILRINDGVAEIIN